MATKKTKPKGGSTQDKTYTFTFTLPSLIGLCSGAVVALCAFFILGILLGRGYEPEKDVPELAMVMPSQAENSTGEVKGGVLKPEELQYMDDLKQNPEPVNKAGRDKIRKADEAEKAEAQKKAEAKARRLAERKAAAEAAAKKSAEESKTAASEPDQAVSKQKQDSDAPVFDYVYQVASFLDQEKAAGFAGTLQGDGLNSYVQSGKSGGKTYYRVFVNHVGTSASTDQMKSVVAKYGIKKPLLRSKTAQ